MVERCVSQEPHHPVWSRHDIKIQDMVIDSVCMNIVVIIVDVVVVVIVFAALYINKRRATRQRVDQLIIVSTHHVLQRSQHVDGR